MFQKSLPYCAMGGGEAREAPRGFLMLAEVALGIENKLKDGEYMEAPKLGTHSTKGVGMRGPDSKETIVLHNGLAVPLGQIVPTPIEGSGHEWIYKRSEWDKVGMSPESSEALEAAFIAGVFPIVLPVKVHTSSWDTSVVDMVAEIPTATLADAFLRRPSTSTSDESSTNFFGHSASKMSLQRNAIDPSRHFKMQHNEYIVYDESQVRVSGVREEEETSSSIPL
jgi:hypothetical protein